MRRCSPRDRARRSFAWRKAARNEPRWNEGCKSATRRRAVAGLGKTRDHARGWSRKLHDRHLDVGARPGDLGGDPVAVVDEAVAGLAAEGVVEEVDDAFADHDRVAVAVVGPGEGRGDEEQGERSEGESDEVLEAVRGFPGHRRS